MSLTREDLAAEAARKQAECAAEGHVLPEPHERPLWWERKPSWCKRCAAKLGVL